MKKTIPYIHQIEEDPKPLSIDQGVYLKPNGELFLIENEPGSEFVYAYDVYLGESWDDKHLLMDIEIFKQFGGSEYLGTL